MRYAATTKTTTPLNIRRSVCGVVACVFFALSGPSVRGEIGDDSVPWKSGNDFRKALQSPVGFMWSERPLREGLTALSRGTGVAIFLDRRIDPSRRVDYSAREFALDDALEQLARQLGLETAAIGSVVYVGPKGAAARTQGLAAVRRREALATPARDRWIASRKTAWGELAEPRELVVSIAASAGAEVTNPSAIPHDVWAAWDGPPLSPIEQLTLVLAGFELTFELNKEGNALAIVPAPERLVYEHSYAVRGDVTKTAQDLKRIHPEVKLRREGAGRIGVEATAEQHAKIADLLAGKRVTTRTVKQPGEKRYTLTVTNEPLGAVIKTIAKGLGVEVKADAGLIDKLSQRVSLKANELSAEELLKQVLDPAGIEFHLTETTLELK